MAKLRISQVIDEVIDNIELQMEQENKHVIKIETVKARAMEFIIFDCQNEDTRKCTEIGFDQMVHVRLNQYGYRSVRTGMFINLDRETGLQRLKALLDSADTTATDKALVADRIRRKFDGQMKMDFGEDGALLGYKETMTEEEFVADLEADAI